MNRPKETLFKGDVKNRTYCILGFSLSNTDMASIFRQKDQELHINMSIDGQMCILCDSIDLCGDIIQSLCEYLALDDLQSTCSFPKELDRLEKLLLGADELQSVRQRLSAEMADHSGMIRTLVVRAEDSRLMLDM